MLLVEHLLSGTSYIYNALFSIRNIEIKMKNLSLFTDIFLYNISLVISIYIDIYIILWYTIIKKGGKESGKEVKKNASNIGPIRSASD